MFWLFDGLAEEGNEVGVIVPAGEEVSVDADRIDRNGVRGVRMRGPADMRFLVQQRDSRFAQTVNGLVHRLGVFPLLVTSVFV